VVLDGIDLSVSGTGDVLIRLWLREVDLLGASRPSSRTATHPPGRGGRRWPRFCANDVQRVGIFQAFNLFPPAVLDSVLAPRRVRCHPPFRQVEPAGAGPPRLNDEVPTAPIACRAASSGRPSPGPGPAADEVTSGLDLKLMVRSAVIRDLATEV
jgi:hypothetical protein